MVHKIKIRSQSDRQCPVCESHQTETFFEALQLPVHVNVLWTEREDAQSVPKGDIKLAFCEQCGHVFNMAFNPDLVKYNEWYENSLHFSSRFQSYARSIADRLIESYDVTRKDIIEIGSGHGDFLELLCELGENRGIGFDPGYPDDPSNTSQRQHVTFVQDIYSEQYARYQADLICCRQTLEHIFKPREFVNMLRRAIGDRRETIGFFEVPNVLFMLRGLSIWDAIYEHYSYFSPTSLTYLFANNGFNVLDQRDAFEGQYLTADVQPSYESSEEIKLPVSANLEALASDVVNFKQNYEEKTAFWQAKLAEIKSDGKKAVIWGAGSKGITFLNALKVGDEIGQVVDINPRKRDMFTAGSGHRIVSPGVLRSVKPDAIIVMNPIYESEIRQQVGAMDLSPEYLFA